MVKLSKNPNMQDVIEAERIYLRRWTDADADALYELAKDPQVGTPAGWPAHDSADMSREVIRTVFSAPETYAVVLKGSDLLVGCVGVVPDATVHSETIKPGDAEIGYWLGRQYWGFGYAAEAVKVMIGRLVGVLNKSSLWIAFYDGNERSKRVAEKCGFEYDHTECSAEGIIEHFYRK